ncbi:MAG: LytR/AlgR family response regulator transcription factor [Bacteroidales bacterium]
MKKLRTIIIDDEISATEAIENILIHDCKNVEIIAKCNSPIDAIDIIKTEKPDFIFLDIEMPEKNGFELLKSFKAIDFYVIFVTAYDEYAIHAIKNNALDYILKPIDIDEIKTAVEKVHKNIKESKNIDYQNLLNTITHNKPHRIKIATSNGFEILNTEEIIHIEACGSYTVICLKNGEQVVVSKSIKEINDLLLPYGFYRSHRSHIINLNHIRRFTTENDGEVVMNDNSHIPLSRRKRSDFIALLDKIL